jgi:two-component system chemotaxis response regulator CheB
MFGTGESAINFVKTNEVDIITMDINLPGIDGFDTSRKILAIRKIPIVIVSSIRDKNNEAVLLKAMRENGALAFLDSPPVLGSPGFEASARKIIATVKVLADVPAPPKKDITHQTSAVRTKFDLGNTEIIVIGVSTGGPAVIEEILAPLPVNFPLPIIIVQHILKGFENLLANTLQKSCKIKVKIAEDKEILRPGVAYLAPADKKTAVTKFKTVSLVPVQDDSLILDTVSHLFASAVSNFKDKAVGILLTGMGKDGARELKLLKNAGAYTIAQDRESSAIYGMPGEAARIDAAVDIMPPKMIINKLMQIGEAVKFPSSS